MANVYYYSEELRNDKKFVEICGKKLLENASTEVRNLVLVLQTLNPEATLNVK